MAGVLSVIHEAAHARPALASSVITALAFSILHQIANVSVFPYDSGFYWHLAGCVASRAFPDTYRGYFFPALLAPFRMVFDSDAQAGLVAFRIGISALHALGVCVAIPAVFEQFTGQRVPFHRRLVVPALLLILFPGVILYPLSDLPALLLMVAAIWCAARAQTVGPRGPWLAALAGFLAYGAYNCRTVYLFSFLLAGCGAAVTVASGPRIRLRPGLGAAFLAGATLAAVPQSLVNRAHHGVPSPAVRAHVVGSQSLFTTQLLWGVTIQKYETSIEKDRPKPSLYSVDASGREFFDRQRFDMRTTTMSEYLLAMAREPAFFAGLLGRHCINGLDVRDGEVYLTSPSADRHGLAGLNLLVVMLGFWVVLAKVVPRVRTSNPAAFFWVCVLLVPVGVALPGAVETRFFLPLHVFLYASIACALRGHDAWAVVKRRWPECLLCLAVAAGLMYAITFNTMSSLNDSPDAKYLTGGDG